MRKENLCSVFRPDFMDIEDEAVHAVKSAVVNLMRDHDYDIRAQNFIILGKINEYFLIDERWRQGLEN
jgi:hypothetical protein